MLQSLFLLLTCFTTTLVLSSAPSQAWKEIRELYAFDRETKWDCFYRTTTPVKGMDPAIWREDQFGNLLMAGLNYNCKGCLCYTFDHRFPISSVGAVNVTQSIAGLMSSIDNCQALSFRTNALKGSNDDSMIKSVVDRFGCDQKTMALFKDKDFMGAKAVQKYLLSAVRLEQIHNLYTRYVNGPNFLDPKDLSKEEYFNHLNKNADSVTKKVSNFIASAVV